MRKKNKIRKRSAAGRKKTTKRKKIMQLNEKLRGMLRFIILFNILLLVFFTLSERGFYPLQVFTAKTVGWALTATGVPHSITDVTITVPAGESGETESFSGSLSENFSGKIDWDCTGWKSIIVFLCLLAATEMPLRRKLYGLIYIPFIYLLNLLRVWFMFFFVHSYGLQNYAFVHQIVWSWGMVAVVLLAWFLWLEGKEKPLAKAIGKNFYMG